MVHLSSTLALLAILLLPLRTEAGTIEGEVSARRSKYRQNVVVYVDAIDGKTFEPPAKPVLMDQINFVFTPHVVPVLAGTTVDFQNSDAVLHNVYTPDKVAGKFNLGTWGKGERRSYTFQNEGSAVILCNVHPEMEAYVVVLPTPYFATTDKSGNFRIEGVPPGDYTVKVWHEKWKAESRLASVSDETHTTLSFTLKK